MTMLHCTSVSYQNFTAVPFASFCWFSFVSSIDLFGVFIKTLLYTLYAWFSVSPLVFLTEKHCINVILKKWQQFLDFKCVTWSLDEIPVVSTDVFIPNSIPVSPTKQKSFTVICLVLWIKTSLWFIEEEEKCFAVCVKGCSGIDTILLTTRLVEWQQNEFILIQK